VIRRIDKFFQSDEETGRKLPPINQQISFWGLTFPEVESVFRQGFPVLFQNMGNLALTLPSLFWG
jgi:hypothetical protein